MNTLGANARDELEEGSITPWVIALKGANEQAAAVLWERYFDQLVRVARKRLSGSPRAAADEEDIALSVFNSLCQAARRGRFSRLDNRNDLWRILRAITGQKVIDFVRAERAARRDTDRVARDDPGKLVSPEPSPEVAAAAHDEWNHLLNLLSNEGLRRIAVWRMEGETAFEIASKLGVTTRTIERKLELIRSKWVAAFHRLSDRPHLETGP